MTVLRAWLGDRQPAAPRDLEDAVGRALDGSPQDGISARGLRAAAEIRLERALARPGRVRESAFELLVADALVTYACEAALEAADFEAALEEVVSVAMVGTGGRR